MGGGEGEACLIFWARGWALIRAGGGAYLIYDDIEITCIPLQTVPFPVNPCSQTQLKEPSVLMHWALTSHGLESAEHSSISAETKCNCN